MRADIHILSVWSTQPAKKRGYVLTSSTNITETGPQPITNSNVDRYVNTSVSAFLASAASYMENDFALPKGTKVKYVGQKPNDYAVIEFSDPSTAQGATPKKIHVYIDAMKLSMSADAQT